MRIFLQTVVAAALIVPLTNCQCRSRSVPASEPRAMMRGEVQQELQPTTGMQTIFFEFDSTELLSASKDSLQQNATWLRTHEDTTIRIDGRADERGTNAYNQDLGKRRAQVAARYLESLGIDGVRISVVSLGEEDPIDRGHNEDAWATNRRVDFRTAGRRSSLDSSP